VKNLEHIFQNFNDLKLDRDKILINPLTAPFAYEDESRDLNVLIFVQLILDTMASTTDEVHPSGLYWSLWWFVSFKWIYNIIRIVWVIVNNFYVIPAYFTWLLLLSPIYIVSPSTFWHIEDVLFGWLLNMVACWNFTGEKISLDTDLKHFNEKISSSFRRARAMKVFFLSKKDYETLSKQNG